MTIRDPEVDRVRSNQPAANVDRAREVRTAAVITATVFLVVGIVGFIITGFDRFADHDTGEKLLFFEINPLHNLVHLVFGLVGLAAWRRLNGIIGFGLLVGLGYVGALVYGVVAADQTWDFLSINEADNWLHLALAVVGFMLAAAAASIRRAPERSAHVGSGQRITE